MLNRFLSYVNTRGISFLLMLTLGIVSTSCDSGGDSSETDPDPDPQVEFSFQRVFPDFTFGRILDIQNAGDGSNRLFVVQQHGVIDVINPGATANSVQATQSREELATESVFLDITDRVKFDELEFGLYAMAFHPDFENNGFFYVHYVADNPDRSVLSRFSVSDNDPDTADPDSELILLEILQPHQFHNGGQVVFGPEDGYLYMTLGDGGPPGGAGGTSQDLTNLLGSVIRIDVDNPENGLNYGIPADNPFAGNSSGIREEIFAYGLRNPFKLAFDPFTGILWAGDVGESSREELDIVEPGMNYGWPIMEGSLCFDPPQNCDGTGLEPPVLDYGRNLGRSVIAGLVYNGSELPELMGFFIYADFVSGRVWTLDFNGDQATQNKQIILFDEESLVTFGVDGDKEPYIGTFGGEIYRLIKDNIQ